MPYWCLLWILMVLDQSFLVPNTNMVTHFILAALEYISLTLYVNLII